MAAIAELRIKTPGKKSLEFFMAHWDRARNPVVEGEYTVPDQHGYMEVDPSRISHVIENIKTETFDEKTGSVVASIRFTGPKSKEAIDEYVRGDIRLIPRCVKVRPPGGKDSDVFESIITWDLAHRPKDPDGAFAARLSEEAEKIRKEQNAKDKMIELAKKRIKK